MEEQFPEVYKWLVDWHRTHVAEITETQLSKGGNL